MAAGATHGGDGTLPPLRHHRTLIAACGVALLLTVLCAVRAAAWWPLCAVLGIAAIAWMVHCARHADARLVWLAPAALATAYAVALVSAVDPLDVWAVAVAALLLLTVELAHAAAGAPNLDRGDPATRGGYMRAVAAALLGAVGLGALLLAAAGAGGSGGAEVTALGGACAAAALALLATTARRASTP